MTTVVLSGNPRPGSRTARLAAALGAALAGAEPHVVDLSKLAAGLLTPGDGPATAALDTVRGATRLVVATPTYKGSYTGILKVFVDLLPPAALAGINAVPVVTAGTPPQAEGAAIALRALLTELGADVAPALTAIESELDDIEGLVEAYATSFQTS
ncbi:NADPH-dependent oxidoreductase [Actinoplanes sp. TBRC 11911]|uniref:NADPH-dependent FMN reductase n=1 Tax=Actinoplanes sp. TBRC 11911 TaxID=2729386 RepID=UPI00145DF145|nr:NAD(P)H-dependent oxidoreductase [Actinoplanes sp. TBRC 11911]NMO55900.1 NADPH-dependent oxidoreductase [Actinoplanes sp. TBRC 11911]